MSLNVERPPFLAIPLSRSNSGNSDAFTPAGEGPSHSNSHNAVGANRVKASTKAQRAQHHQQQHTPPSGGAAPQNPLNDGTNNNPNGGGGGSSTRPPSHNVSPVVTPPGPGVAVSSELNVLPPPMSRQSSDVMVTAPGTSAARSHQMQRQLDVMSAQLRQISEFLPWLVNQLAVDGTTPRGSTRPSPMGPSSSTATSTPNAQAPTIVVQAHQTSAGAGGGSTSGDYHHYHGHLHAPHAAARVPSHASLQDLMMQQDERQSNHTGTVDNGNRRRKKYKPVESNGRLDIIDVPRTLSWAPGATPRHGDGSPHIGSGAPGPSRRRVSVARSGLAHTGSGVTFPDPADPPSPHGSAVQPTQSSLRRGGGGGYGMVAMTSADMIDALSDDRGQQTTVGSESASFTRRRKSSTQSAGGAAPPVVTASAVPSLPRAFDEACEMGAAPVPFDAAGHAVPAGSPGRREKHDRVVPEEGALGLHEDSILVRFVDVAYIIAAIMGSILAISAVNPKIGILDEPVLFHVSVSFFACCTLFTAVWLALRFFVQNRKGDWEIIDHLPAIRRHYLRTWFVFDLLCWLPIEWCFVVWHWQVFFILQMRFLLRLGRIVSLGSSGNPLKGARIWYRFLAFCVAYALIVHCLATLFGVVEDEKYLNSLYWAVLTVTSVGYGDVVPETDAGKIYTIFAMIVGICMISTMTAFATSVLTSKDKLSEDMDEKKSLMDAMLDYYDVPWEVRRDVIQMFPSVIDAQNENTFRNMSEAMPGFVRRRVDAYARAKLLRSVPLFQGMRDMRLVLDLSQVMTRRFIPAGDYIVNVGDVGREMFFIIRGVVEVLYPAPEDPEEEIVVATLRSGEFFGEIALLEDVFRTASVQAVTLCELLVLDKEHLNGEVRIHLAGLLQRELAARREKTQVAAAAPQTPANGGGRLSSFNAFTDDLVGPNESLFGHDTRGLDEDPTGEEDGKSSMGNPLDPDEQLADDPALPESPGSTHIYANNEDSGQQQEGRPLVRGAKVNSFTLNTNQPPSVSRRNAKPPTASNLATPTVANGHAFALPPTSRGAAFPMAPASDGGSSARVGPRGAGTALRRTTSGSDFSSV